jgi:[ribosomal protein S18]-alanine N-acetyltransferase
LAVPGNIRLARPDDIDALADIDALVNSSAWRPSQFAAACSGVERAIESALVLETVGGVCGFIVVSRVLDEGCIHNLAVHPAQQGRGMGRYLVATALDSMRRQGASRCLLEVRASNSAARGLYGALDFQLDGVRKNYYPTSNGREDALLMSKEL